MDTGIYMIINESTGDFYVGSASVSLKSRLGYHKRDLKANKHHSNRLQNSWNKYGGDCFIWVILEECSPLDCINVEQSYIDLLDPSFNMSPTAGNCLGVKHSEETRFRMSMSKKGKPSPRKGVKVSEEARRNISLSKMGNSSKKGTKCSEESKKKMSEVHKNRIRVYSEETRKKLSAAANKRWGNKCL